MVLGLEDTIGYNPLRLADYERAVGAGENAVDPNLRHFPGTFRGYRCSLAGLLGLEYLVLDRPLERLPKHFPRLNGAPAPLRLRRHVGLPAEPERAARLSRDAADPGRFRGGARRRTSCRNSTAPTRPSSIKTMRAGSRATTACATPPPIPIRRRARPGSLSYGRNDVSLAVETDRNSVLVLHDIYYPGWEAYVDGERRPILRANLLFRGVEVPPGRHRVEFRFRPLSVDNLVAAATDLMSSDEAAAETVTR